jgi:hypothetical protein
VSLKYNFFPFLAWKGIDRMVERVFRPHFYSVSHNRSPPPIFLALAEGEEDEFIAGGCLRTPTYRGDPPLDSPADI